MHVTEHVQVADLAVLEGEDRHADPPYVSAAWRYAEQLFAMIAVEAHFAAYARTLLDHRQDIGRVRTESRGYEIDIAGKFVVPDERGAE